MEKLMKPPKIMCSHALLASFSVPLCCHYWQESIQQNSFCACGPCQTNLGLVWSMEAGKLDSIPAWCCDLNRALFSWCVSVGTKPLFSTWWKLWTQYQPRDTSAKSSVAGAEHTHPAVPATGWAPPGARAPAAPGAEQMSWRRAGSSRRSSSFDTTPCSTATLKLFEWSLLVFPLLKHSQLASRFILDLVIMMQVYCWGRPIRKC